MVGFVGIISVYVLQDSNKMAIPVHQVKLKHLVKRFFCIFSTIENQLYVLYKTDFFLSLSFLIKKRLFEAVNISSSIRINMVTMGDIPNCKKTAFGC